MVGRRREPILFLAALAARDTVGSSSSDRLYRSDWALSRDWRSHNNSPKW